jgi:hypothetical protein
MMCGTASKTMSGNLIPLSWTEINAFKDAADTIESGWDCQVLRQMSTAYITGKNIGDDVFGICPGQEE